MSRHSVTMLLLATLGAAPAWAQVHKCTDAGGRISYSDLPCATAPAPAARPAAPRALSAAPAATAAPSPTAPSSIAPAATPAAPGRPTIATVPAAAAAERPAAPAAHPAPNEAHDDLAARRAAAAQTADCNASLRQMGTAGAGMKLVEAGNARGSAIARCTGG